MEGQWVGRSYLLVAQVWQERARVLTAPMLATEQIPKGGGLSSTRPPPRLSAPGSTSGIVGWLDAERCELRTRKFDHFVASVPVPHSVRPFAATPLHWVGSRIWRWGC